MEKEKIQKHLIQNNKFQAIRKTNINTYCLKKQSYHSAKQYTTGRTEKNEQLTKLKKKTKRKGT